MFAKSATSRFLPNGQRRNKRIHTCKLQRSITWTVKKNEDASQVEEVGILKAFIDHPNIEKGFVEFEFTAEKTPTLDIVCRKTAEEHVCTDMQKDIAADIFDSTDFYDQQNVIQTMKNKNVSLPALWSWMSKFRRDELDEINGAIHHKDAMWRVFKCLDDDTKMELIVQSHKNQFDLKDELFLTSSSLHATGRLATWAVWIVNDLRNLDFEDRGFTRLINLIQEHERNDGLTKTKMDEMNLQIQELRRWFASNKDKIKIAFVQKIKDMMMDDLQDMEREMFNPMYARTMCILYLKGQMPKIQDVPDFACGLLPLQDQMVAMFARKKAYYYLTNEMKFDDLRLMVSNNLREWIKEHIQRGQRSARPGSKDRFRMEDFYENQRQNIQKMADASGLQVDTSTLDNFIKTIEYHGNTDATTSDRVFETTQEIMVVAGLRFNRTQSSTRFDLPMQIDMNRVDEIIINLKKAAKKIQEQKDERKPRQSATTTIWDRKGNKFEIELTGARLHDMPMGGYIANLEGKTYPLMWMENQFRAVPLKQ